STNSGIGSSPRPKSSRILEISDITTRLTGRLARRDLALRPRPWNGQNKFLEVAAVNPLLLFDGFQVIVDDQTFALRRGCQMLGEEAVRQTLARDFFATADEDLDRQKVVFGVVADFDQEAGRAAKRRHAFKEHNLVRVQIVKSEQIAFGSLRVKKEGAAFRSDSPAVIRLGFR